MAAETKLDTSLLGAASELPLTEEQRLRDSLQANPLDFDSHTALLALIEKGDQPAKLKEEVSGFLRQYPLCYGFWKKLADSEANVSEAAARAVYEQSVKARTPRPRLGTRRTCSSRKQMTSIPTCFEPRGY